MNLFTYLLTISIFIGYVISAQLGWPVDGDLVDKVYYPFPFYLLLLFLFYRIVTNKLNYRSYKYELLIICICLVWLQISRRFFGLGGRLIYHSMALPAMYAYLFFSIKNKKVLRNMRYIIIIMYVLNISLAIIERITLSNLFPIELITSRSTLEINDIYNNESIFRSSALLGYPLSNALITAIVMSFILISKIRTEYKFALFIYGLIGMLCFNTRAALVISIFFLVIYLFRTMFKKGAYLKGAMVISLLFFIGFISISKMFELGYGGRFIERDVTNDSSVDARFEAFNIISQVGITNLLWGLENAEDVAESILGTFHVENWFILSAMTAGLFLTCFIIVLYIPVFKKAIKPYTKFESLILLGVCLGVSSTNNSLACGVPAIALFIACCRSFEEAVNRTTMVID